MERSINYYPAIPFCHAALSVDEIATLASAAGASQPAHRTIAAQTA